MVLERIEEAQRQKNQAIKANAMLSFETAMKGPIERTLKKEIIKTLADVRKGIFIKDLDKLLVEANKNEIA